MVQSSQGSPMEQQSSQGAPTMQSSQDGPMNQMESSLSEPMMQSAQAPPANQSPQSELVLQTIGYLNTKGELLAQIELNDEVVALLTKVGDEKATRLLNMLDERASTIRDP